MFGNSFPNFSQTLSVNLTVFSKCIFYLRINGELESKHFPLLNLAAPLEFKPMSQAGLDCEQSLSSPNFSEVGELAFGELASRFFPLILHNLFISTRA